MDRRALAVVFAAVVVAVSVAAPAAAGATSAPHDPRTAHPLNGNYDPPAVSSTGGAELACRSNESFPDPGSDVLGWEDGCWYNETLPIDQTDGLSESERAMVVARSMARIEHVRELEFEESVPITVRSREAYRREASNRSTNATLRTFDNVKFEALFLIGEDTDSIEVQNENSGSSVLGFYDPRRNSIVLIAENESAVRIDEATLAHELVHALQDQHYNLSNYRGGTRDEVNAIDGLIEGDANYVEYLYMERRCNNPTHPWNGTCVRPPPGGGAGDLANIGVYFVKFQPYSDGPAFVRYFRKRGGWEAVNELYADLPESAEQVIHPEKYGTDPPTVITLFDGADGVWRRVRPPGRPDYAELGESGIASMLVFPLYESDGGTRIVPPDEWLNLTVGGDVSTFDPLNYGFAASEGWDGDRMYVYRNAENETAYVWRIAWDSPEDVTEFLDAYREVLRFWGAKEVEPNTYRIEEGGFSDAFHVESSGSTVTIVNAPTVEALSTVRPGIDGETDTPTPPGSRTPATPTVRTSADPVETTPSPSPSNPATSTPGQPGFGIVAALLALALGFRLRRR